MLDTATYTPRFKTLYKSTVRAALKEQFGYSNDMMIPRLDKIVLNMGVGEAVKDTKKVKNAEAELTLIAGQKAVITKAKNSIAGFRVREHMPLGCKVTLRGDRMYEFLERLITVALPRKSRTRGRATAVATMPWASRNTSSSRKSTSTRSTRSWGWTSSSAPPRSPTRKPRHC